MENVLVIGLGILLIDVILRLYLLYKELQFSKKKYDDEEELRKKHEKWLSTETMKLKEVAVPLGESIQKELVKDVTWLTTAMIQAKIGTNSKTLFGERLSHFEIEKKFIAEKFVPLLLNRCQNHINNGKEVCLLIDSGTTLFDFFEVLSEGIVSCSYKKQTWIDKLYISTNNLPGIEIAMEKGRVNPQDRFSPLAFKCHFLPGEPLAIYGAVTGNVTIDSLKNLKRDFKYIFDLQKEIKDPVFIGITVGNWIRIRRSQHFCPVPMARGKGHLAFKQEIVNCSDEVFVISPLGKVFKNVGNDEINEQLGLNSCFNYPDEERYDDLDIKDDNELTNPKKIKLVSTSRSEQDYLLHGHSESLKTLLKPDEGISMKGNKIENVNHIMFPFPKIPDNRYFEIEMEFPHKITRNPEFLKHFFSVNPNAVI
ncbi:MAG: hypothetical protein NTZ33_15465 [Bacteroidetes bacterium]|nr:hypothetical protein [Bacteroidota bacterium]